MRLGRKPRAHVRGGEHLFTGKPQTVCEIIPALQDKDISYRLSTIMAGITLVADNPRSWIIPYVHKLKELLEKKHTVVLIHDSKFVRSGDMAFFLSCEKIAGQEILSRNTHNLVVHESALPKGRGWSPLTWQILEGKHKIPITLFEAELSVDSGVIYSQKIMKFTGDELVDEFRKVQGEATITLVTEFVRKFPKVAGKKQRGKASYYPRRLPKDSELNINKPLKALVNQLRVADNERYPAFFLHKGKKYILKIFKEAV